MIDKETIEYARDGCPVSVRALADDYERLCEQSKADYYYHELELRAEIARLRAQLDDERRLHACTLNAAETGAREIERLRALLRAVAEQFESKNRGRIDAPGHSHTVPGIWDSDNGELAGKPCAWCALWKEAKAAAVLKERLK